ncbi:MAG: protoporphyrinogen oxidase, partial [Thermomicrobiales bacterium]|nr:protoporphyrinogen oxidase [Thermomicrobiales bacterium]
MSRDAIAGGGGEREPPRIVVVGGGIAGLTAAFRLSQRLPDADIVLLEREARLGGKIVTERRDGFVIEGGPEAMLVAKPQAQALCRDLELEDRLLEPNSAARGSSVLRGGRLIPLPDGLSGVVPTKLRPIAASPLIPPLGKLRMGFDFVLPRRREEADEALSAFVERRLGRDAYRWLVEPLVGGIYAGDGARLSLAATFPQLRQMERDSGGLIRGALAARKAAPAPPPGPRPSPFRAPRDGLGELIESLAARLQAAGVRVETNATAEAIVATPNGGFVVSRASGETLRADAVVCAAPAPVAAGLLSELDPALAKGLGAIPYASVANVSLAYPLTALPRPLVGSGYLAPRAERRPIN